MGSETPEVAATQSPRPADKTSDARPFYWQLKHKDVLPDGAELAALRRGVGRDPGTVPSMWRHYARLNNGGHLTAHLRAEHEALTLFAVHQQSLSWSAHASGTGLGAALKALRESGKFSPEAVDRRFSTAATATTLTEASYHLRGLVRQLRQIRQPPLQLDYTALFWDLVKWQNADGRGQVRRRWASEYFWEPGPEKKKKSADPAI